MPLSRLANVTSLRYNARFKPGPVDYNRCSFFFRDYLAAQHAGAKDDVEAIGRRLRGILTNIAFDWVELKKRLVAVMTRFDVMLKWDDVIPPGWPEDDEQ